MGEDYVEAISGIKRHTITTGPNRPDFAADDLSVLIDSKNVASQGLTKQLQRYLGMGYDKTIIYVRLGTKLSPALKLQV